MLQEDDRNKYFTFKKTSLLEVWLNFESHNSLVRGNIKFLRGCRASGRPPLAAVPCSGARADCSRVVRINTGSVWLSPAKALAVCAAFPFLFSQGGWHCPALPDSSLPFSGLTDGRSRELDTWHGEDAIFPVQCSVPGSLRGRQRGRPLAVTAFRLAPSSEVLNYS